MFDHVTIRVEDRTASERFYDTVLRPLGIERTYRTESFSEWQNFMVTSADGATPATRRLHVAFAAPSHEQVDEFWRIGTEAGLPDDGQPGTRPEYRDDYYGAFLVIPTATAPRRSTTARCAARGVIDHLWIRVADVAAAKRFYETIAPYAGLRLGDDTPDRVQFVGTGGSFSLVPERRPRTSTWRFPPTTMTTSSGSTRPRPRPATRATATRRTPPLPPRLLRRLRPRSRRQQHRSRQPPPGLAVCSAGMEAYEE